MTAAVNYELSVLTQYILTNSQFFIFIFFYFANNIINGNNIIISVLYNRGIGPRSNFAKFIAMLLAKFM